MDKKFLGICIVIASLLLSGTIIYTSLFADKSDRYKVAGAKVFDTQEGIFVIETTSSPKTTPQVTPTQTLLDMNEVNRLLEDEKAGRYITPIQRRTLTEYYKTQYETWANQYQKDYEDGKVDTYSKYDSDRIKMGEAPLGKYKNKSEEPFWMSELSGGKRYTADDFK